MRHEELAILKLHLAAVVTSERRGVGAKYSDFPVEDAGIALRCRGEIMA